MKKKIIREDIRIIIPTVLIAFYFIMTLIPHLNFVPISTHNWRYTFWSVVVPLLTLITPGFALAFFITYKKEYAFKKWLLPIAFGSVFFASVLSTLSSLFFLLLDFGAYSLRPSDILGLIYTIVGIAARGAVCIGVLSNLKHITLLRIGSLVLSILLFVSVVIKLSIGGYNDLIAELDGIIKIDYLNLFTDIAATLFHVGIFIFSTKKMTNPDVKALADV